MTTASSKVPHDDFAEGFKVGFQTVQGTTNAIPGIPGAPGTPGSMTPFLMGVQLGIKAARGELIKHIAAGPPIA